MSPFSDIDVFIVLDPAVDKLGSAKMDRNEFKNAWTAIAADVVNYNGHGTDFADVMYCPMVNWAKLCSTPSKLSEYLIENDVALDTGLSAIEEIVNCVPESRAIKTRGGTDHLPAFAALVQRTVQGSIAGLAKLPTPLAANKAGPWNLKQEFYRPLQLLASLLTTAKGNNDILNTVARVNFLRGDMFSTHADTWIAALDAVAAIRIRAEVNTGGEHLMVYFPGTNVPGGQKGTVLTNDEKAKLDGIIPFLTCLHTKAIAYSKKPDASGWKSSFGAKC